MCRQIRNVPINVIRVRYNGVEQEQINYDVGRVVVSKVFHLSVRSKGVADNVSNANIFKRERSSIGEFEYVSET